MVSNKTGRKRTSVKQRAKANAPAAGSSPAEVSPSTETRMLSPGAGTSEPDADPGKKETRRRAARGIEQLLILSLAIIFGLVGFAVHVLWIGAVIVMALLWGYIASGLRSSRHGGGVISDVVTTIGDEARDLKKEVSGGAREADADSAGGAASDSGTAASGSGLGEPDQGRAAEQPEDGKPESKSPGAGEATKKELYEEAREAGIEGRSNMSKAELKEALDD
jgi:hypothetical protein